MLLHPRDRRIDRHHPVDVASSAGEPVDIAEQIEFHFPNRSGTSRHGAPVRYFHTAPSTADR